jgi:hypothetical protein
LWTTNALINASGAAHTPIWYFSPSANTTPYVRWRITGNWEEGRSNGFLTDKNMEITIQEVGRDNMELIAVDRASVDKNMTPDYFRKKMHEGCVDYVKVPSTGGFSYMVVKNEKYEYFIRDKVDLKELWKVIIIATKNSGSSNKKEKSPLTESLSSGLNP